MVIRNWRIQVVGGQTFCYFDPSIERFVIIPLTRKEQSEIVECDSGDAFESESENAVEQLQLPRLGAGYLKS